MEDRFVDIETKLAYQEDLIDHLNKQVADQQGQIDQLKDTCRVMIERVQSFIEAGGESGKSAQEAPPHY